MKNQSELDYLKNYKPSIDDLKNRPQSVSLPRNSSVQGMNKKLHADVLALTIILKDLVLLIHGRPLSTKDAQDLVDKLNQIADDITKQIKSS